MLLNSAHFILSAMCMGLAGNWYEIMLLLPLVHDSGVIDQKVFQISARKKINIFIEDFFF